MIILSYFLRKKPDKITGVNLYKKWGKMLKKHKASLGCKQRILNSR